VTIKPLSEEKDKELGLSCFNLAWKSLCGVHFRLGNILVNGKHLDLDHIPEEVGVKGLDFKMGNLKLNNCISQKQRKLSGAI